MARVLVVDDADDVREYVRAVLRADGHEVVEAANLAEARERLASADAAVVDIDLPDGDGISLIPVAAEAHPPIRVVVVTGDAVYEQTVRALHAGAYDFIPKPIEKSEIRSAVRRAVETRALEVKNLDLVVELAERVRTVSEVQAELLELNGSLERRIEQRTEELRAANERLVATNKRLEETRDQMVRAEKMASIGSIAAGVAHEINNPIGFINSNLQTLRDYVADLRPVIEGLRAFCPPSDPLQARMREIDIDFVLGDIETLVRESEDGVRRVVRIVKDLKTFSRVDAGAPEEADLLDCVESALSLSRNETKYIADVRTDLQPLPRIRCFPVQVTQVLVNLLVNAAHAMSERGTITVATRLEAGAAVIEVSDTGCGIPPENLQRIFDPFFTTKEPGRGTGLGLFICWEIVQRHEGELSVDSTVGRGTTFRIRLPLARKAA